MAKSLWDEFSFLGDNPDKAAGLLYCLRYNPERIKAHQACVVETLQNMGVDLLDLGFGIGISLTKPLAADKNHSAISLLEELSCLNEAIDYHDAGYGNFSRLGELSKAMVSIYLSYLQEKEISSAYDLVSKVIPELSGDLRSALQQGYALPRHERDSLASLEDFALKQREMLEGPKKYALLMWTSSGLHQ